MNQSDKKRLLITFPLVLSLLFAIAVTFRFGIADLYAYSPRQSLEHWQKSEKAPAELELLSAIKSITSAISWQPKNAEYRDIEALLYYYQAIQLNQTNNISGFKEMVLKSAASYRQSTQLRPNWPYSWANLALMKASAQQFDDEYQFSINQAIALGPWENAVNISITEAGLMGWKELNSSTKAAVVENIERTIKRNTPALKQRLIAINKLGMACIHLKASKERKRLCGF